MGRESLWPLDEILDTPPIGYPVAFPAGSAGACRMFVLSLGRIYQSAALARYDRLMKIHENDQTRRPSLATRVKRCWVYHIGSSYY